MNGNIRMYAAPMEGLTGFAWRKAHSEVFGGADKYFTPFIVANQTHKFKTKELRDISQEEESLIPQLLTDKPEHFIWAAEELRGMGFKEINLNLGCPSATVVTRGKGSGLLRDLDYLNFFLDKVYESLPDMKISIKTRIGFEDRNEWPEILNIFNRYPVHELIIHCRLRSDFYSGNPDIEAFRYAMKNTEIPLVYNGDAKDTSLGSIMAGRGLIADPALFRKLRGGLPASAAELKEFHDLVLSYYLTYMDKGPALHHMKEMWTYFKEAFNYDEKDMKNLRKSKDLSSYQIYAVKILGGKS